jgi:hypothetical protein
MSQQDIFKEYLDIYTTENKNLCTTRYVSTQ